MSKRRFSQQLSKAREFHRVVRPLWTTPFMSKELTQEYIQSLDIGVRAPIRIATFQNIDQVPDLCDLPNECVVKPIAGNGNRGVFVIKDRFCLMSGNNVTRNDIQLAFKSDLSIAGQKVIVEEFVQCAVRKNGMPRDYKFYNFGKKCAFIHIIERNSRKDQRANRHFFIDDKITPFPLQVQRTQVHCGDALVLPECFPDMIKAARAISQSLCAFVRVDLYADQNGPIIGELTPYPHGGRGYLTEADEFLGRHWRGRDGASHLDFLRYAPLAGAAFAYYFKRRAIKEFNG